jgi:hypothetical protein
MPQSSVRAARKRKPLPGDGPDKERIMAKERTDEHQAAIDAQLARIRRADEFNIKARTELPDAIERAAELERGLNTLAFAALEDASKKPAYDKRNAELKQLRDRIESPLALS